MSYCTNIFVYVAAADLNMHSYLGSQQKIFVLLVQSLHVLIVEAESLRPGGLLTIMRPLQQYACSPRFLFLSI